MNEKKDKGLEKITNLSEEYIKEFQSKDKEENEVIKEIAEGIKKEKPEITEKKETEKHDDNVEDKKNETQIKQEKIDETEKSSKQNENKTKEKGQAKYEKRDELETKHNGKTQEKANNKNRKYVVIGITIIVAIFLIVFSVIFSLLNITNDKILNKVSIMGIDVSNMSQEEAIEAVDEVIENKLTEELTLKKEDYETTINALQINAQFDVEGAVNDAYNIGKSGNIVTNNYSILFNMLFGNKVECNFSYDQELLDKKVEDISAKLPGAVVQSSYYIEDEDLIIVKGEKGLSINEDKLKNNILNQIKNVVQKYRIVEIPTEEVEPEAIDLEKIRNEIYKEPQDAYVSKNPTTVHAHINGVDFAISIEEAQEILAEDKSEYVIPLKITVPEKTIEDLGEEAFPDELSSYSTRYDPSNMNRSNNIEISAGKIDGTIIMPGETFSYNQTVGERTIAEGYKEAGAYAGGRVVQDVGGGICQTSSTLYNTALLANLEIVDRSNHQFLTSYVSAGRDATVSWGSIDFQFKNSRKYPIKIEARAKNGVCKMSIYGIKEENEYEVEIESNVLSYIPYTTKYESDSSLEDGKEVVEQSGYNGCTSEAYRVVKLNGEVISRTLLSKDTYDPMTRIIKRGTKKVQNTKETSNNNKKLEKEKETKENTNTEKRANTTAEKEVNVVSED